MTDIVDSHTRSRMMSGIKGSDTKPERLVGRLLHARGFRYRLHRTDLPGRPDLVLPRHNCVVFVHGCFWHGHDCHLFKPPQTRPDFWHKKISGNRIRDKAQIEELIEKGWRVMVVWECALKGKARLPQSPLASTMVDWIANGGDYIELEGYRDIG